MSTEVADEIEAQRQQSEEGDVGNLVLSWNLGQGRIVDQLPKTFFGDGPAA